jgi:hypothetical protein
LKHLNDAQVRQMKPQSPIIGCDAFERCPETETKTLYLGVYNVAVIASHGWLMVHAESGARNQQSDRLDPGLPTKSDL